MIEAAVDYETDLTGERVPDAEIYKRFRSEFLMKPGRHLLAIGHTESGKTQKLYWLTKQLLPFDLIGWMDCGKSYEFGQTPEIAPLFNFKFPINIILPAGVDIEVMGSPVPVEVQHSPSPGEIWDYIKPGYINIFVIAYYFTEPDLYAKYISLAFERLIYMTQHQLFPISYLPMSLFIDEFHDVAPGQTMALSKSHLNSAKKVAWNINKIRSAGIRIVGGTQKWQFVYPNCRVAFQWILCCRGAFFDRDEPDLARFNSYYKKINVWNAIMWFPKRLFQHKWKFPIYQAPPGLKIKYIGSLNAI